MSELDRLIDEGLNRYGSGDLDGALEAWEEALAIDPDNAQANSYVDYVRQNYDILATDGGVAVTDTPFGIESEPEYTIEIVEGEVGPAIGTPTIDDLDGGWFINDDDPLTVHVGRAPSRDMKPRTLELEADEPPPAGGISFDETTREYVNQKPPVDEFAEESSFRAESTPLGFGTQDTEIKPRNTGFVQPVPRPPVPSPGGEPPTNTAELRVRVRTPSGTPPLAKPAEPPPLVPPSIPPALPLDLEPLDLEPLELAPVDRAATQSSAPPSVPDPTEDDLLGSLPIPRRMTPVRGSRASVPPTAETEPTRIPTRDLPAPRPPAAQPGTPAADDVSLANAPTRDLAREAAAPDSEPTAKRAPIGGDDPVIGIPTRELGLRPPSKRAPSVFPDEDATTTQSDARQIRREAAEAARRTEPRRDSSAPAVTGGLDARSMQILAEVDDGFAGDESKDERVRRRISGLIMHAAEWNASGELDKAVTAVDLALSEDPTSALAQKLLHRNRDAIMTVFQSYLGDLERQPQLAKPLHELAQSPIGSRAAFLLSRIDGMLSIDEILDVSGMPRLEAYRHLCQLFLRGILR